MTEEPDPSLKPQPQPQWGGMPQIMPQEGAAQVPEGGSYSELSPGAMQMMWAPQQQQIQLPPPQV